MIQHNQWAHLWQLDKSIAYLNHGSYGSVPVRVQEAGGTITNRFGVADWRADSSVSSNGILHSETIARLQ